jgi:protein regulator of cytokinesis 1
MLVIVDTLVARTRAWEQEHGMPFTYDGVPLLAMLDEYKVLRQEKEEEKRRMRVFIFFSVQFDFSMIGS